MAKKPQKQPKKQSKNDGGGLSATEIARLSGLSSSRVYCLLSEGRSVFEILMSAQRRQQREAARLTPLPAGMDEIAGVHGRVNGANGTFPAYSASLAKKEAMLAAKHEIEVMERRGELLLASDMNLFASRLLIEARDILLTAPSELADTLAAESDPRAVERILRNRMESACERFYQLTLWSQRPPEAA